MKNPARRYEAPDRRLDLTGMRFGMLTVLRFSHKRMTDNGSANIWVCRCDCGNEKTSAIGTLRSGRTLSCGCHLRLKTIERNTTHGLSNMPEYTTWKAMKARCSNPNADDYANYGGRGISVCQKWENNFPAFLEDMGRRPDGMSIDRIDTNGNYEPGNCRWLPVEKQSENRRVVRRFDVDGQLLTIKDIAVKFGVKRSFVNLRLVQRGQSVPEFITSISKSTRCHRVVLTKCEGVGP